MELCQRCNKMGTPYTQNISGRTYLYIMHKDGKTIRKCYIGPIDEYSNVAKMYNISMLHAFSVKHRFEVFKALLSFFESYCDNEEESSESKYCKAVKKLKRKREKEFCEAVEERDRERTEICREFHKTLKYDHKSSINLWNFSSRHHVRDLLKHLR